LHFTDLIGRGIDTGFRRTIKIEDSLCGASRLKLVGQTGRKNISTDYEGIKADSPIAISYQMLRDTRRNVKH
jgi:hypothetical protein